MTASPVVGAVPGASPVPDVDETPPVAGGPADGTIEEEPPRRRRKLFLLLFLLLAFLVLLGLAIWYLLFRQPIPIPSIPGEVVMPGYVTSIYGPNAPMGVVASADGSRIYIGETEGDRVARVFDAAGTEIGMLQPPLSTGTEHVPIYLALDPETAEVYVSDRRTGAIYIYDAAGTYQREFDPGAELEGWQPVGMAFDDEGNLYVTDVATQPQQILVFNRAGDVVRKIGATAGLNFPNGIAVDGAGNVYVTDSSNGRLLVIDENDAVVARVGRGVGEGNLGLPRGVAIENGRVLVGDATGHGVFVYATLEPGERTLKYLGFFGGQGATNGTFQYPNGVAFDDRGRIYVTDAGNDRVQVWSY